MRAPSQMPITAVLVLAIAALASACASSPRADAPDGSNPPSPSVSLLTYRCESGARVRATYPTDTVALVRYQGQTHEMQVARTASGVRYVGDGLQWWTQGNGPGAEGTLSRAADTADANGEIVENCAQVGG